MYDCQENCQKLNAFFREEAAKNNRELIYPIIFYSTKTVKTYNNAPEHVQIHKPGALLSEEGIH